MIREIVILESKRFGTLQLKTLPKGLKEFALEWERNKELHGMFLGIAETELRFLKEGRSYLINAYESDGPDADVRVTIRRSVGDGPYMLDLSGRVDFTTSEYNHIEFKANISSGHMELMLLNRDDVNVLPSARETVDGQEQPPLTPINIELASRTILRQHLQKVKQPTYSENPEFRSDGRHHPAAYINFGESLVSSMPGAATYSTLLQTSNADIAETLIVAEAGLHQISAGFKAKLWLESQYDKNTASGWTAYLQLIIKRGGSVIFNRTDSRALTTNGPVRWSDPEVKPNTGPFDGQWRHYYWQTDPFDLRLGTKIDLQVGDQVFIYTELVHPQYPEWFMGLEALEGTSLDIAALTETTATQANCYAVHEVLQHVIWNLTGRRDAFYSDFYGRTDLGYAQDGEGALLGFISGYQARNVPDKEAPFTFKNLIKTLQAVHNVGVGTEWKDGKRVVRIEKKEYFFREEESCFLSRPVGRVTTKAAPEFLYNTVTVGYQKWEESADNGADEYCTKQQDSLPMKAVKSNLEIISPYRGDGTGLELARRKQYADNPAESHSSDSDWFCMALWRQARALVAHRDQGFSTISGTIAGTTAINLLLSPRRMLLRHLRSLSAPLKEGKIKFQSGEQNTGLATQLNTESQPVAENSPILVSALPSPYHKAGFYTIAYPLGELERAYILNNPYGWVRFTDELGMEYRGYPWNIKYNRMTGLTEFTFLRK